MFKMPDFNALSAFYKMIIFGMTPIGHPLVHLQTHSRPCGDTHFNKKLVKIGSVVRQVADTQEI